MPSSGGIPGLRGRVIRRSASRGGGTTSHQRHGRDHGHKHQDDSSDHVSQPCPLAEFRANYGMREAKCLAVTESWPQDHEIARALVRAKHSRLILVGVVAALSAALALAAPIPLSARPVPVAAAVPRAVYAGTAVRGWRRVVIGRSQ
jgi:hypothetical protein